MFTVLLPSCIIKCDKENVCIVADPEQCQDKELVKYLNCSGLVIQNITKKECQ